MTGWSLVRAVLLVGTGLVALGVALAASTVLWWLAIAAALAAAFHPVVTWLRRWIPAWAAIITVIIAVVAFVGLVGYRGAAELSVQFAAIRDNALAAARSVQSSSQFSQVAGEFGLVDKTTRFFQGLPVALGGDGGGDPAATVQSASSIGSALFAIGTFAVLLLVFGQRFVRAGLAQIDDPSVRARIGALVVSAYRSSYRYVWLMAGRAIVVGIVGGLVCTAFGLETPTALGVAFAALSLIPGLGIVLAAVPIAIYLAISSPITGIAFISGALVTQALETSFVQGRIDARSVHVGPTATLVFSLLGLQLYGFGGVLVGLAVGVYTLAVLRELTDTHNEVLTAMRRLMREGDTVEGAEISVGKGSTVIVDSGTDVVSADDVDDGEPAGEGKPSS